MGQYIIKQKLISIRDRYMIKDANGVPRFLCVSTMLKLPVTFWLKTPSEVPLYSAKGKVFSFLPKYTLFDARDREVGQVKVKFSFLTKKIIVKSSFGDFFIKGNVWAWDFKIHAGLNTQAPVVAQISKKILNIRDSYSVKIQAQNEPFIMLLCIILDNIYHRRR